MRLGKIAADAENRIDSNNRNNSKITMPNCGLCSNKANIRAIDEPSDEKKHPVQASIGEDNIRIDRYGLIRALAEEDHAAKERRGEEHLAARGVEDQEPDGDYGCAGHAGENAVFKEAC